MPLFPRIECRSPLLLGLQLTREQLQSRLAPHGVDSDSALEDVWLLDNLKQEISDLVSPVCPYPIR